MSWACVARYGGIGDNLIASSVFGALRAKYGRLEVITQTPQSCVFENNPHIDKLTIHAPGDIPGTVAEWHQWHVIRSKGFAFFANLSHSVETETCLLPLESKTLWPPEYRRKKYGRSYLEVAADICGVPIEDCTGPEFFPTEEEEEKARATLRQYVEKPPVIGWVLSGSRIDKIHPASSMAVARLISELKASVMLFGAPGRDHDMAKQIQGFVERQNGSTKGLLAGVDEKSENQAWGIRRILTMLRYCDLVISPDTGPAWSVAIHPVPKLMLLSHASQENITKHWVNTTSLHADQEKVPCWPCHTLHDSLATCTPDGSGQAAACISSISVEAIIRNADQLLSKTHDQRQGAGERTSADESQRVG